jgi:hypothetical protein
MSRLMLIKFTLAALALAFVGITLSTLSNSMLEIQGNVLVIARVMMPCMAVTLAGLSTGLGARFMELRPKTPAQILSGYGGTLNLILSLLTVILMVMVPGVATHFMNEGAFAGPLAGKVYPLIIAFIVGLSAIGTCVPLWIGHRTLRNRDY